MGLSLFREVEVLIALLLFREVEVPQWAIASRQENINSACQGSVWHISRLTVIWIPQTKSLTWQCCTVVGCVSMNVVTKMNSRTTKSLIFPPSPPPPRCEPWYFVLISNSLTLQFLLIGQILQTNFLHISLSPPHQGDHRGAHQGHPQGVSQHDDDDGDN